MSRVPIHRLTCSACGRSGCLQYHGSYRRKVRSSQGTVVLRIQRVKCTDGGRTHALLLSSLVPYSQIAAETQRQIAETFETKGDRSSFCTPEGAVDENDVKAVIMRYRRYWRERLRAEQISLDSLSKLVWQCFAHYAAQFLQIRRGCNLLFAIPT